jgi:hypothetical protein
MVSTIDTQNTTLEPIRKINKTPKQLAQFKRIQALGWESRRGKHWKSIARDEARKVYLNSLVPHMSEIMRIHLDEAKKPLATKERLYMVDQLIGQATKSIELEDAELKLDI